MSEHSSDNIHVTTSGYLTGFILATVLTIIPFMLVIGKIIENRNIAILVLGLFAVVQILVHMYYFLHLNGKIQGGWTASSTIFTVIVVAISISGTLWVMFHLRDNMMPKHEDLVLPKLIIE